MTQRILSILSWVGVVLVFAALVVRFTKPEWDQYATYAAYKQLRLKLQKPESSIVELRTGSVAEIDGQFKFVSYIRD